MYGVLVMYEEDLRLNEGFEVGGGVCGEVVVGIDRRVRGGRRDCVGCRVGMCCGEDDVGILNLVV